MEQARNFDMYEVEEIERSYQIEGVTDQVSKFSTNSMSYPNIRFIAKDKNPQSFKLQILSNMRVGESSIALENREKTIMVYFKGVGLELIECGKVYQTQLRALIKLFEDECEIIASLDKERTLTGKYVYAMCT